MTTATIAATGGPTDSTVAAPRERAAGAEGRLTFEGVLRGEWLKLLSLRSIRWSIAVLLLLSWGGAALVAAAMSGTEFATAEAMPGLLVQAGVFGAIFTVLVVGVLGVLAVTSEYASGLVLSSLSAVPSRTPLLVAKALVVAALSLAVGAISTFGGAFIAALIMGDGALGVLFDAEVLVSLLGCTVYLALAALMSLGIGALMRSSAGAISIVVVLLFVSTLVFQFLGMTGWEWVPQVSQWMPAELGHTLSTAAVTPPEAMGDVGYWGALGGLAAWAAAALVPAGILLKTRDAM